MRYCVALACLALPTFILGLSAAQEGKKGSDEEFLKEAASDGMLEVKLGQLADAKAANAEVRKFGRRMVTDHTKANQDLMTVAKKIGVAIPKEMNARHQALVQKLQDLKGADFDRAYMGEMVKDHQHAVKVFTEQAKAAQNEEVRAFAGRTLPHLQEHLQMAREVATKVGAGEKR
jgi:putative membrane protein